jgi:uncharacterized integral membrane protein
MVSKKILKIMRHFIKWFFIVSGVILWITIISSVLLTSDTDTIIQSFLGGFWVIPMLAVFTILALTNH